MLYSNLEVENLPVLSIYKWFSSSTIPLAIRVLTLTPESLRDHW
jgi:hypothetical protein